MNDDSMRREDGSWDLHKLIHALIPTHEQFLMFEVARIAPRGLQDLLVMLWQQRLVYDKLLAEHLKLKQDIYDNSPAPQLMAQMYYEGEAYEKPWEMKKSYRLDWKPKMTGFIEIPSQTFEQTRDRHECFRVIVEQMVEAFKREAERAIPREMHRIFTQANPIG